MYWSTVVGRSAVLVVVLVDPTFEVTATAKSRNDPERSTMIVLFNKTLHVADLCTHRWRSEEYQSRMLPNKESSNPEFLFFT